MLLPLLLAGCGAPSGGDAAESEPFLPASARLHRLTDRQWRYAAQDLTGVAYTGALPEDYRLYGYTTVGAGEATLAPVELEEVEAAAWAVALAAVYDGASRDAFVGCSVAGALGSATESVDASACVRGWVGNFGREAWRRPLTGDEINEMVGLFLAVTADTGDATLAIQGTLAAFLLSPHFLYRVELGVEDPDSPGVRRLTAYELAARLSFFLTNAPPDQALLFAAERGDLATDAGIREHLERLLATDRGREALVTFWDESMSLHQVDVVTPDPTMFPEWNSALAGAMRQETRLLFEDVVLNQNAGFDELFTTSEAWVNGALGDVYGLEVGGDALMAVTMPDAAERGGVLGRGAFLAINANATFNSPTHRGKHIRSMLLCQEIPAPPANVPTIDAAGTDGTLRERLSRHMEDPSCNSCHALMDPIGFGLEHFNPIGRWQTLDNALPIDATGELDGMSFDGAVSLGEAVALHPNLGPCVARQLYNYAKGEVETEGEAPAIDAIGEAFVASGLRFRDLVTALVLSEGFRTIGAPAGEACTQEGEARPCRTDCGGGTEICAGGAWVGCDAPAPSDEACDGVDNNCDGVIDEGVYRACETAYGPGLQECVAETWSACIAPGMPIEVCNGADDDGDGAVDESLATFLYEVSYGTLTAAHGSCDPAGDPESGACHAAIHRTCAASGCGVSGFAMVAEDTGAGVAGLGCVDATQGTVINGSFAELTAQHGGCTGSTPRGPDCNAAIHRWCAAQGWTTGFGPSEYSGDAATYTCTPGATVFETTYTSLSAYDSRCDGSTDRAGAWCTRAFHLWCQGQGFLTGYGPLENSGDVAYAACLGGQ